MADTAVREPHDFAPDLMGVKSRVSWSAILAGAVIAFACYFVLTLLFAAVGVSLTEGGVRAKAVGIGVLVAMILTMIVSLFLGGWVATQLTAGENRQEAVIYGLLTWAAVTAGSVLLVGMGVRAGYFAVLGGSVVAQNNERIPPWEELARNAGVSQQRIDDLKATADPARAREIANDPAARERAEEAAMYAAWTALVATMLSMASAVGGAMVGRGAAFRLFPAMTVRRQETRIIVPTA